MTKQQKKECAENWKKSAKELIDGIGTDTEEEQRVLKLIYGFARSGFRELNAGREFSKA